MIDSYGRVRVSAPGWLGYDGVWAAIASPYASAGVSVSPCRGAVLMAGAVERGSVPRSGASPSAQSRAVASPSARKDGELASKQDPGPGGESQQEACWHGVDGQGG